VRDAYTNLRVEADKRIISDPAAGVTRIVKGLALVQTPPFTESTTARVWRANTAKNASPMAGIARAAIRRAGRKTAKAAIDLICG
jgi:hypothetical protein